MKWDTDRTNELILRSQAGDTDARRQLAEENAPLVRSLVRRFIGRGTDYEELCQVGNIGLLKAVAGFNPKLNVRFSTYAVPMISGEIKRFVRDNNTVKMPRSLKDMQQKIRYARQKLSVDLSREPGAEEIANEIGCDLEDVLFALESLNPCVSLDEPLSGENDLTVMDTVEDRHRRISETDKLALRQCIEQLDEKEKKVIILRYFKDCTQMRVADMMGLSQVQISRIESRTIEKLRRKLGVIVFEKNAYCYKGMEGIKMNEIMNTARQAPVRTNVNIENRERISVTGITRVDSFDEGEVSAATDNSGISVYGQNLHISRLDLENGILTVDGFITGVEYSDKEKREGLFSRIFK